jgi:hypothetical protein
VPEKRATSSQVLRRFTLGSGPLKRTSDRLQFLARVLLACALVLALPVALTVATVTHSRVRSEATAQAVERHQVRAMLQEDAVEDSSDGGNALARSRAMAVWTGPPGMERTGLVGVPTGAEAGSTVSIWVDEHGDHVRPPLDDRDVVAQTVGTALLTYLCIALVVWAGYFGFRRALDRSRLRRWATDWAAVEPLWRRELP